MTLEMLNALDRNAFVHALGWVFDGSPWIAERTWPRKPFSTVEALHAAMIGQINGARRDEQLALLRAHPDLGARVSMSAASAREQSGAGLQQLSGADLARLQALNLAYREKFGFPFLFAVKGATAAEILAALERRLGSTVQAELAESLRQVHRIARFRLDEMFPERGQG
jgi:OHCU decarboxylase